MFDDAVTVLTQPRPRKAVNGVVDAGVPGPEAVEQRRIRGIDNGVDGKCGDVTSPEVQLRITRRHVRSRSGHEVVEGRHRPGGRVAGTPLVEQALSVWLVGRARRRGIRVMRRRSVASSAAVSGPPPPAPATNHEANLTGRPVRSRSRVEVRSNGTCKSTSRP